MKKMKKIIIICTRSIQTLGINLKLQLLKLGYDVNYKFELTRQDCFKNNILYIILYYSTNHGLYPKNYIIYQIEQTNHRLFKNILYSMNKSLYVWDFSNKNKKLYERNKIVSSKFHYTPFPFCIDNNKQQLVNYLQNKKVKPKYDILFYGAINERREIIINFLKRKYKVFPETKLFGNDLQKAILQSKIIINLHYYDACALETCRINEVLQYNKLVLSETVSEADTNNKKMYENMVVFFDRINKNYTNLQQMYNAIDYYLIKENYNDMIEKIKIGTPVLERETFSYLQKNIKEYENKYGVKKVLGVGDNVNNEDTIVLNFDNIGKVLYGSENGDTINTIDVTTKFKYILNLYKTIKKNTNINYYFGDPCEGIKKKLTIVMNDGKILYVGEGHLKLEKNISIS